MAMGGKLTEGGPGPVVLDGQVLESSTPASVDFDVTFTDGTTARVTVREKQFPGDTASFFEVDGRPAGLSPERAASSWAWHKLMDRSIDGDHATGIALIQRARVPPTPLPPPAPGKLWEFPGG